MPTRPSSSVTQKDLAFNKRRKLTASGKSHPSGQAIQIKPEHAVAYDGKKMYIQEIMTPAPARTALAQTSQFSFIVENDAAGLINDAVLRFDIESSLDTKLMPVPLWFDRIEWYDRHTGREIARYHGDTMHWLLQTMERDTLDLCAGPANFDAKTGKESTKKHKAGRQFYYLPLPHVWLDGFSLDLSLLRGDLEIKFYPKGDIKVSPTDPAVVQLHEIRWIGNSEMFSQLSRVSFRRSKALATHQHNYIDFQQYTDAGRVLTAGTPFTIDLDQFHHESAFLWICFRKGSTGDSNINALRYQSLGPKATIDHENVHGRSLLGDGTPIDEEYFRKWIGKSCWPHEFNNYNAVYCIPFSNDVGSSVMGEIDGYHEFRGDRERLAIVPDHESVNTSFTLVGLGGTASDNDVFSLSYDGHDVTQMITGVTLVSQVELLINELPSVIKDGIEFKILQVDGAPVAPADTLTSKDSFVVGVYERGTFNSEGTNASGCQGQPYIEKQAVFKLVVVSAATRKGFIPLNYVVGKQGFVSGTYQIDVYSMYYRHIQEHNGRIEVEDM